MSQLGEKHYLIAASDEDNESGIRFYILPEHLKFYPSDEHINLGEIDPEVTVPRKITAEELRQHAIKTLREKQERVIAEAQKRKAELQVKIDQLLMLSHMPVDAGDTQPTNVVYMNGGVDDDI